jgi:DNA-binding MarR family transcriptional regulator
VKRLHNKKRRTAPSPDARRALSRLFEFTVIMSEAMERDLSERGLTRARATVIAHLHHRGPMRQRELAEALRVTPRNVTGLLDALEATGFVGRFPHPSDRRATLATLTAQGTAVGEAMDADEQQLAAFLFAGVSAAELAGFRGALDRLVGLLGDEAFAALREAAIERWPSRPTP